MSNDRGSTDKALDSVNGEKGFNFPKVIQAVVGGALLAGLLGLARCAVDIGNRVDTLSRNYDIHVNDGLRKHSLIEREIEILFAQISENTGDIHGLIAFKSTGERFTAQDGNELLNRLRELEAGQTMIQVELARLPQTLHFPFSESWQDRILDNERRIAECNAKFDATKAQYSAIERTFMAYKKKTSPAR